MRRWLLRLCTMPKWTKESSISELTLLINEVDSLTGVRRHSAPHTRWLARTLKFLEQVFGAASTYYLSLVSIPWSRTGTFIVPGSDLGRGFERAHQEAYINQLDSAKGLLQAALDELQVSELTEVYVGKDTGPESSAIFRLINLLVIPSRKSAPFSSIRRAPPPESLSLCRSPGLAQNRLLLCLVPQERAAILDLLPCFDPESNFRGESALVF